MKVYLFQENNGLEYEDYHEYVSKAFLVPDDFSESSFYNEFLSSSKQLNLFRTNKNGSVNINDSRKVTKLYKEYFSRAFEEIKIYGQE